MAMWPLKNWTIKRASDAASNLRQLRNLATHDLHYHYDGSISKEVVCEALSGFVSPDIPVARVEQNILQRPVTDPQEFFKIFERIPAIFELTEFVPRILGAALKVANTEGIDHLDYRFGCGMLNQRFGCGLAGVMSWFSGAFAAGLASGMDICPTYCFSRHEEMGWATRLRDHVLAYKNVIRAIDLEGPEQPNETRAFGSIFRELKSKGFRVTVHAGEFAGPKSIWQAIEDCAAERIGHGTSASEDPALMQRLAKDRIPLEVCLTSNYLTGACKDLSRHPFLKFLEVGIPVVLCTDDKAIFQTTLVQEYERAAAILIEAGHNPAPILKQVAADARRFAFTRGLA